MGPHPLNSKLLWYTALDDSTAVTIDDDMMIKYVKFNY
jgi:hypothetical protein